MPISKKTPVYDIMTKKLIVADLDTKLSKAQEFFIDHGVEHLPIVHDGTLVGIVSEFDLMKMYARELSKKGSLTFEELERDFNMEKVMTSNPVTISPDTTIGEASQTIVENKFEALPVIDGGDLVGLVTAKDLVDYLAQLYS